MGLSLNQAKQLFVAYNYETKLTDDSKAGTITAKSSGEDIILKFVNAKGQPIRSDIMPICNIMYANVCKAEDQREYMKSWELKLKTDINKGKVVSGEDYIVNVKVDNYYDNSDNNSYIGFGAVHGFEGMSTSDFYVKMAISLATNFSRLPDVPITVWIGSTQITPSTKEDDWKDKTATSIIIKECQAYWARNSFQYSRYRIGVSDVAITVEKADVSWANITETTSKTEFVGNGMKTCDLEDFVLSLHGDYHLGYTYPLSSMPMANPDKEYNYLTIHYFYAGGNENPQRSEKDIVVVSDDVSVINSIVGVINSATGKSFPTIKATKQTASNG